MSNPPEVEIGGALDLAAVSQVAECDARVRIAPAAFEAIRRARDVIEALCARNDLATYGVNTGFGALAEVRVAPEELDALQENLLRSHAAGVGPPLDRAQTRAMMLLRAHVLALGYSGVRQEVVDQLVAMLNARVHPVIPSRGSVGASGDLAPLAHLGLVLIGRGEAEVGGRVLPGAQALAQARLEPLRLKAKEGLALINGTQGMTAIGALALHRARTLVEAADVTGAMSLEALLGSHRPFEAAVIAARPHPGALASSAHLRALLADSPLERSHANCGEVQDAYSLRCMPQVHGAARDVVEFACRVVGIELGSATDNPLVLPDGRVLSGGNFHGQPVAVALDAARAALADLASIAERRLALLCTPAQNRGLPAFLSPKPGLHSGFMMAQVTAASLVSELRSLAWPVSVDSVPTSADREDHVSMGMTAARHLATSTDLCLDVLAIEAVTAAQGLTIRATQSGRGVRRALAAIRAAIPPLTADRELAPDFARARELILAGSLF
jgi:histidine ammonia-lyase